MQRLRCLGRRLRLRFRPLLGRSCVGRGAGRPGSWPRTSGPVAPSPPSRQSHVIVASLSLHWLPLRFVSSRRASPALPPLSFVALPPIVLTVALCFLPLAGLPFSPPLHFLSRVSGLAQRAYLDQLPAACSSGFANKCVRVCSLLAQQLALGTRVYC